MTCDLDSTLCDTTHRHAMIDRVNGTDWVAYSKACVNDTPILATATLVRLLDACDLGIVYLTGRAEEARDETLDWFTQENIPWDDLFMDSDPNAVNYSHATYKLKRMQQILTESKWREHEHVFHIDDYADVKFEFEAAGIPCLCVRTPEEIENYMREQREGPK